jgi:hypothetical protein
MRPGSAFGELRDDGATEAVTDEHDRPLIRLLQSALGSGNIVREPNTADVLGRS